ncbi:MAG: hypothetical protein C4305_05220 [Thermoleophilia bacterium]
MAERHLNAWGPAHATGKVPRVTSPESALFHESELLTKGGTRLVVKLAGRSRERDGRAPLPRFSCSVEAHMAFLGAGASITFSRGLILATGNVRSFSWVSHLPV